MIVIAGASGGLGRYLYDHCPGQAVGTHFRHAYRGTVFADFADSTSVLRGLRPEAVISCVAFTDVDGAQFNPRLSYLSNFAANANLADWCSSNDVPFVFVSTNGVFSGNKGRYRESDIPDPINLYGIHKLMAEEYVRRRCRRYFIVRCALLETYNSAKGEPFVVRLARAIENRSRVRLFTDAFSSPVHVSTVGEFLFSHPHLCDSAAVIHLFSSRTSNVELAERMARQMGATLDAEKVSVDSVGGRAPRWKDISLRSDHKASEDYPHAIERELARTLDELRLNSSLCPRGT